MNGLPPAGQWKPNPPPVGAEVALGGRYRFRVTLHGPNTQHACVDCGALAGTGRLALAEHPPRRL